MKQIKIKVLLELDKPSYCDFIISEKDNLEVLHHAILQAYSFSGEQMASFYEVNEYQDVIHEFPFVAIDPNYEGKLMKDILCFQFFKQIGDQLLYIYDYLNEWKFSIECIELNPVKSVQKTPFLLKQFGKIPGEHDKDISGIDAEKILMNAILGDEFEEDDEDDLFDSDNFDSIDDYEEYL